MCICECVCISSLSLSHPLHLSVDNVGSSMQWEGKTLTNTYRYTYVETWGRRGDGYKSRCAGRREGVLIPSVVAANPGGGGWRASERNPQPLGEVCKLGEKKPLLS